MKKITSLIAEKAGISESQAETAVTMLLSFLKDKMPEEIGNELEGYLNGNSGGGFSGIADKLGDILGK